MKIVSRYLAQEILSSVTLIMVALLAIIAAFSGFRIGLDPQINAVGTLMVVGVTAIVGISFVAARIGAWTSGHRRATPIGEA